MILLSWNCRGLGNLRTVHALQSLVKTQGPGVLFLMETKLDSGEMESIRVLLGFNNMFVIPSHGRSGGLVMLWRQEMGLEIRNYSRHHIDCGVSDTEGKVWRLIGFYGHLEAHKRSESWALLDHLHRLVSHPWLCMGDFNEVMLASEHRGQHPRPERQMRAFRKVLAHCQLGDMGFQGVEFTWDNRRRGLDFVQLRLDRVVSNVQWHQWFLASSVVHLPCSRSDHAPVLVRAMEHHNPPKMRRRLHRFEEKWAYHPDYEEVVRAAWGSSLRSGNPMFRLCEKIKEVRMALVAWSSRVMGWSSIILNEKLAALDALKQANGDGHHGDQLRSIEKEVDELLLRDEVY